MNIDVLLVTLSICVTVIAVADFICNTVRACYCAPKPRARCKRQ